MSIPATVGSAVTLVEALPDGYTGSFPQAEIYEPGNPTPVATIDLTHIAKGRYEGSWTPTSVGTYSALFIVYADAAHTVESIAYTREAEQIFATQEGIDDLAAMLVRLLGLNLENSYIDNCTYDANQMMLTGRLRIFDTKANLDSATEGGVGEPGTIAELVVDSRHWGPNRLRWMKMGKII